MGRHMLVYHVAVPLGVFALLLLFGVPLATAVGFGLASGCASMVVMMIAGGGHHGHRPPGQQTDHADAEIRGGSAQR